MPTTEALLDRATELDAITATARAAASGRGGALLVEGPAGIGKTAVMLAGRQIAHELGLVALTARGAELECDFGFGVVRQLFEQELDDRDAAACALAGRARPAAALLEVELPGVAARPPRGPDAPHAMLNALYWLTSNLARRAPLMLLVDDAHWADPASLRFLSYIAHRLESLPVLLIVAARPAREPGGEGVARLLGDDIPALHLGPLGPLAAAQLLRAARPDASDDLCRTCFDRSGGNPFFLRELAEVLRGTAAADAARVLGVVPPGVTATVRSRIDHLPAACRTLADAVAVLGEGTMLRDGAHVAGLDVPTAQDGADMLINASIFASRRPLHFMHPLVRSAVYENLSLGSRARAHERAARMLAADGASTERVAAHLLACEPRRQPWVCEALRAAARDGTGRGAPEAAVTYLRRALEEPPPAQMRPELLLELGEAEAQTLDPGQAADHLARGIKGTRDPERRLHAALLLAGILGMDDRGLEGVDVLDRALRDSQDADPALVARIEAHLTNVARHDLVTRRRSAAYAGRVRDRARAGELMGGVELAAGAAEEAMAGDSAERTAELAQRAGELLTAERAPVADFTVYTVVRSLLIADRFDLAGRVLASALKQAREQGAVVAAAIALSFRCELRYRVGALRPAQADGAASLETTRAGWRIGLPATAALLAQVLVERGDLDAAARAIDDGGLIGPPGSAGTSYPLTMLLQARGRLQLAREKWGAALEDLQEVGRRQEIMGEFNPSLMDWRSQAACALAELGRSDEALALADEEVRLARRYGAPRALGLALRAAGVIQDPDSGLSRLHEAETVLAESPARLAHAHVLASLGSTLRRSGERQAAGDALNRALDLAHRCGAAALETHARHELHLTGRRPRRSATHGAEALTPSERRVAERASQGLSNREIAEGLFVTVRTVEFHLSGAFRKLGISSRHDLAAVLTGGTTEIH
jgi:DNA-binding CsgD family transcriptional regulator